MICDSVTTTSLLLSELLPSRCHGWSQEEVEKYRVQTYFLHNRLNVHSNWLLNGYLPFFRLDVEHDCCLQVQLENILLSNATQIKQQFSFQVKLMIELTRFYTWVTYI